MYIPRKPRIAGDEITRRILEMYQNGDSIRKIANTVYLTTGSVYYRLSVSGIERQRQIGRQIPEAIIDGIRRDYIVGNMSIRQIAKKYGVSHPMVIKYGKTKVASDCKKVSGVRSW